MGLLDNVAHRVQKLAESSVKSAIGSIKETLDSSPHDKDSQLKNSSPKKQQTAAKSKDDSGWGVTEIVDDLMDIF